MHSPYYCKVKWRHDVASSKKQTNKRIRDIVNKESRVANKQLLVVTSAIVQQANCHISQAESCKNNLSLTINRGLEIQSNILMKPEALEAFATQSIRPGALEAASAEQEETGQSKTEATMTEQKDVRSFIFSRPTVSY